MPFIIIRIASPPGCRANENIIIISFNTSLLKSHTGQATHQLLVVGRFCLLHTDSNDDIYGWFTRQSISRLI